MDFNQGAITTIHQFEAQPSRRFIEALPQLFAERPAGAVIPLLAADLHAPSMDAIIQEMRHATYLRQVVVALTTDRPADIDLALQKFGRLPSEVRVLWCEQPEVRSLLADLGQNGLDMPAMSGKGFAVWLGTGIASIDNYAICYQDADMEGYDRYLAARLLFPLVSPDLDYYFSKAFYARVSDNKFYGRATRLFVWPFLDALMVLFKSQSEFVRYLRTFRYPLAGEFAATSDLIGNVRVPTDWGLEGGLLSEVYRNASLKRICQVDLGFYSHKHRPVGSTPSEGLSRMARDFTATIFRSVTEMEGVVLSDSRLLSLRVLYRRHAQDYVRKYHADAIANGLDYDRHEEETAIEQFMTCIEEAGRLYFDDPKRNQMPDWLRTTSARHTVGQELASLSHVRPAQLEELGEFAKEA